MANEVRGDAASANADAQKPGHGPGPMAAHREHTFTIQSVSKPFTAVLVIREHGDGRVIAEKIGLEAKKMLNRRNAR